MVVPLTVLIVDDHSGFRSHARALLEADGIVVVGEAPDGATALEQAWRLLPDLVLVDVGLPDMDGFVVCRALTNGSAPIVVLTSTRDASSYRRRLEGSGARAFIPKSELSGAALAELAGR